AGASNREGNGAGGARLEWPVCEIIGGLTTNISADPEADRGARDVVEAATVKAADLHVLHRRCLDRHVGGLRPSDRNQSRGRPEEKTFHHWEPRTILAFGDFCLG